MTLSCKDIGKLCNSCINASPPTLTLGVSPPLPPPQPPPPPSSDYSVYLLTEMNKVCFVLQSISSPKREILKDILLQNKQIQECLKFKLIGSN